MAVPKLDDLRVERGHEVEGAVEVGDRFDGQAEHVVLGEVRTVGANVVEENLAAAGADAHRQAVVAEGDGAHGGNSLRGQIDLRPDDVVGAVQGGHPLPGPRVPRLDEALLRAGHQEVVHRVEGDGVQPGHRLGFKGLQVGAHLEVEAEDLRAGADEEGVAGDGVVGHVAAEAGDARLVVEAELRVQLHVALLLEEEQLRVVLREDDALHHLRVEAALELQRQLVHVVAAHPGLVDARRDDVLPVRADVHRVAHRGHVKVLN